MTNTVLSLLRNGRITGSRVAAVLGISPYGSADDVLREMVRAAHGAPSEFAGNAATEWGVEHERFGIAAWEDERGEPLLFTGSNQRFRMHPLFDFLGVTPDGLTAEGNVIEVKAPLWGGYAVWQDVPWYEAQVRLAIECVGADWGELVVWRPGGTVISRIDRDPWWLDEQLPALEAFRDRYEATVADPSLYGPLLEPLTDVRTDPEWGDAAARYLECVASEKAASVATADARAHLLSLTDKPAKGGGVSVTRSTRKGSTDWKALAAKVAPEADPDEFRRDNTVVWTVRCAS